MDGLSQEIGCIRGILASVRNGIDSLKITDEARLMLIAQLDSVPPMLLRLETNYREGAMIAQREHHRQKVSDLQDQLRDARNENQNIRHMCEQARPLFHFLAGGYDQD